MPSKKSNAKAGFESDLRVVPVRVEPGMFKGEYLVHLEALNPSDPKQTVHAQLFADEHEVKAIEGTPERGKPVPALLVVSLMRQANGLAHIILPQPAQPLGESLFIEANRLEEVGV
jgi:hypothetical protein